MNEINESVDFEPNPVVSLGDLIRDEISVGALATAIENEGIYCYDRYGRFLTADCKAKVEALDLLAEMYAWSIGADEDRSPLDMDQEQEIWKYEKYGWPVEGVPNFESLLGDTLVRSTGDVIKKQKKSRHASLKFIKIFIPFLVELAKRDPDLDLKAMPGVKEDLRKAAIAFNPAFNMAESTFSDYIKYYCKFVQGGKSTDHYEKLFSNQK